MSDTVVIVGLPGAGKSRWIAAQQSHAGIQFIEWQWGALFPAHTPVWWLVDLRCNPEVFAFIELFCPRLMLLSVFLRKKRL